ncbi:hypothetical protein RRF57_011506 [Xylaria bambusicola]|uniref:SET domain-containing protein n=1 Tax=Xylaria bambusicola TaxID=326684 RepID=A0AAN7V4N9_9PEZI
MVESIPDFLDWAIKRGVKLNGIEPQRIPGRGIGVIAIRDIQPDEIILEVPTKCLRTITTMPKARLRKCAETSVSVHGAIAADLTLDKSSKYTPWDAIVPSSGDLIGMPFYWPPELQALLPPHSRQLLAKQKAKLERDWSQMFTAFPELHVEDEGDLGRLEYEQNWLLVNSRTFYYLNAALKKWRGSTKDDHMTLQPVADLFNHADEGGCHVAFGSDGFTFRATRPHKKGEEVHICYGNHGGDFLLVEYGFVMAENCWDETLLDNVMLAKLDEKRKERLEEIGFLGSYVLDRNMVCHRTQVALRLMCCKVSEWMRFVNGNDDGEASQNAVDALLLQLLQEYAAWIDDMIARIPMLKIVEHEEDLDEMKDILVQRWRQIRQLLDKRIRSLEQGAQT